MERSAPPIIGRKDRERIVTVSAVISGAPLGSVVAAGESIIDRWIYLAVSVSRLSLIHI